MDSAKTVTCAELTGSGRVATACSSAALMISITSGAKAAPQKSLIRDPPRGTQPLNYSSINGFRSAKREARGFVPGGRFAPAAQASYKASWVAGRGADESHLKLSGNLRRIDL